MPSFPTLKSGDAVAIVATARKVDLEDLTFAISYLEEKGFIPLIGTSIGLSNHQMAGTDQERAADLMHQIKNPKVKAIWCAKGGYGSVRILSYLNSKEIKKNPKYLIGYSDVTALHAYWYSLGLLSIHGQMPVGAEQKTKASLTTVFHHLIGKSVSINYTSNHYLREGIATAPIVGGNLSMIYSICGSSFNFNTEGKILFLEDLDEYLYHIDRMMMNLKNNNLLNNLAGVIVGGMSDMNDNPIPFGKTAEAIIWEYVKDLGCPVAFNFPAGHIKDNRAFIQGGVASLEVTATNVKFKQS